jgi:zinc protease
MNIAQPEIVSDFTLSLFDVNHVQLLNGLNCYSINNRNSDIVKFSLVFKAGTKYGNAAVIKLVSQLVFDGSHKYKGDSFAESIDRKGAYVFSKPNADRITFSLVCQKKNFKELLSIFLDAVFNPEYNEDKILTAIRIEKNRLKEAFQYSTTLAEDAFIPAVFGSESPYSQVLKPESYTGVTRTDLVDFHQAFIDVDNAYALLSGDIDDDLLSSYSYLDELKGKGFQAKSFQEPFFQYKPLITKIVNSYSSQSFLLMGKQTITKNHSDYIDFKIVSTLLGGYIGSRLMQNIREKSGFTYDIYASLSSNEQVGLFRIGSEIQVGKENEVLYEIENEIKRLQNETISEVELSRLKNYVMGELLNTFDGMFARDGAFLSVHNYNLDLSFYEKFQYCIKNLNAQKIISIAIRYLDFDSFTKITVVPK